jgi:hypothetical protein
MVLPQNQNLRLICVGTFLVFLGWLLLHLILQGRDVSPAEQSVWSNTVQQNAGAVYGCAVLLAVSLAVSLWADADQSNVAFATSLYTGIVTVCGWIILILDTTVTAFKNQFTVDFYQNVFKTTGAFCVLVFALLVFLLVHAMSISCKKTPDDRPQFQKLAMIMLLVIVFATFLLAVSSIATQDDEQLASLGNDGLTGSTQIVLGVLFICAFIPYATMNVRELINQIAFWVTFLICVYGWALLIFVGRKSADDKVGGCTDSSLNPCRVIGLAAAGTVLIVLAETFMVIFIYLYARGGGGGGGGSSSSSNQSSG